MTLPIYQAAAQEAARRAAVVLEEWRQKFQVREKGRCDLVTDADLASQKTIQEYLAARFPDVHFVYPVHLNPNVRGPVRQILGGQSGESDGSGPANLHLIEPQGVASEAGLHVRA